MCRFGSFRCPSIRFNLEYIHMCRLRSIRFVPVRFNRTCIGSFHFRLRQLGSIRLVRFGSKNKRTDKNRNEPNGHNLNVSRLETRVLAGWVGCMDERKRHGCDEKHLVQKKKNIGIERGHQEQHHTVKNYKHAKEVTSAINLTPGHTNLPMPKPSTYGTPPDFYLRWAFYLIHALGNLSKEQQALTVANLLVPSPSDLKSCPSAPSR